MDAQYYFQDIYDSGFLDALLADRTTKKRIVWATDTYGDMGCKGAGKLDEMTADFLLEYYPDLLRIRMEKRSERTRKHGEVFTPLDICKKMCDYAHKVLRGKDWQKFINATVLEITCGEAPFLASRRNQATGEIVPVAERFGLLDRKLKVINEKVKDRGEWLEWVFKAFQATYGYEFQGDNLLLARINLLRTFEEYLWDRWTMEPTDEDYKRILDIIVWNIWQMDGLTGTLPFGKVAMNTQGNLFTVGKTDEKMTPPCVIKDWKTDKVITYLSISGSGK